MKQELILYEFTNFTNIIIGFYAIGYCLLVKATEYNYSLLYGLLATMIILCLSNILIKDVEDSYYNKFLDYFTNDNLKWFARKSGQFIADTLASILFIYPLSEFVLWILTFITSQETITNFAINFLPYSYHPQCVWFPYFMVNLACLGIGYLVVVSQNRFCWGSLCGLLLLYAFFDEQFYDKVAVLCNIIGWIGIIGGILYALKDVNIETSTIGNNASTVSGSSNNNEQPDSNMQTVKPKEKPMKIITTARQCGGAVRWSYKIDHGDGTGERGGGGHAGTLHSFSASSVNIIYNKIMYTYDADGNLLGSSPYR